jgi:hypothetical protein
MAESAYATSSKSQIRNIAEMLEVLNCSKSCLLGLCQKLLSVKNHLSLNCLGFYNLSPDLNLFGRSTLKCKSGLRKFSKCWVFTLHRPSLWKNSGPLEGGIFCMARGWCPQSSKRNLWESKDSRWEPESSESGNALKNLSQGIMSFNRRRFRWAFGQPPFCKIMQELTFAKVRLAFQATSLAQKFSLSKISVKVR